MPPPLAEHGRRSHNSRDIAHVLDIRLVGGEQGGDPDRIDTHGPHRERDLERE